VFKVFENALDKTCYFFGKLLKSPQRWRRFAPGAGDSSYATV